MVGDASVRVIVALEAAGRSRATIKRHQAEFNAFAGFLEGLGRALPTEVDCLDFIAERSGSRLAGLRERTSCGRAQLARRPLLLLMEALAGGVPEVGQATTLPVERCPARFRAVRDEYLGACRRRGNAEATVVSKRQAADQFLAYLEEVGREMIAEAQARDLAGFWARRQRRGYAPKTTGSLRSVLADFLGHLHEVGQIEEDLAGRLPPQRYPRRGQRLRTRGRRGRYDGCWSRSIGSPRSGNAITRFMVRPELCCGLSSAAGLRGRSSWSRQHS